MAFPTTICPNGLQITDRTFGYRSEFESGHVLSRARTTRVIKIFSLSFSALTQAQYLKIVEHFHDCGNHTAFEFTWPMSTSYLDAQSTCDAGFDATTFSVRYVESDLNSSYNIDSGRWELSLNMEQV